MAKISNSYIGASSFNTHISGWDLSNIKKITHLDMTIIVAESTEKQYINTYNKSFHGRINAILHGKKKINSFFERYWKSDLTELGS